MNDDALLWNHEPPRLSQPRPSEHLWTMRKDGRDMESRLLYQGEYGVEVQFFYKGQFYQSRRWTTRALAIAEAEERRVELERDDWLPVSG